MSELVDPLNAPEIFFDGIHEIKIIEGVVRIALFSRQNSVSVVTARLAIPMTALPDVIQSMMMSLAEAANAAMFPPGVSNNAH